jgi:methylmalonyl-CoA/ethylmalonyl-CoA epimerase
MLDPQPAPEPAAAATEPPPMLTRIDHVGIAVTDLDEAVDRYTRVFGLAVVARETHDEQGVHEAMLQVADGPAGGSYVQLLQPSRPESPVGRFLGRRGEGLHHVGYGVPDVAAALAALAARGVTLVDERPRHGSMGAAIAFLHPTDLSGVLTELVQAPGRAQP